MKWLLYIILLIIPFISGCTGKPERGIITELTIEDTPEMKAFAGFWEEFSSRFNSMDTALVRKNILDSIWLFGEMVSADIFMKRYVTGYANSDVPQFVVKKFFDYHGTIGCGSDPPVPGAIKREGTNNYNCREIVIEDTLGAEVNGLKVNFLETRSGYRLSSMNFYYYKLRVGEQSIDTIQLNPESVLKGNISH